MLQHRCLKAEMFYSADVGHEGFWQVGIARNAMFFHSFVASQARTVSSQKRELRRTGCPRCRLNLHHAEARERFPSKKHHTACSEHFWKLSPAKFAPRCGARAVRKPKPLKHQLLGTVLEVQIAFRVAGAGVREGCKNVGRRGGFEEGPKWQAQGFRAL